MSKELNPNEAPPGHIAVPYTSCRDCSLNGLRACGFADCTAADRNDGCPVGFAKRSPANPALLLDVLTEALKIRGFDGLFRSGVCACRLDELSPVQCMSESCRPGVLLADATCDNCTKEAPCAYHIGDPPKLGGQPREETA